MKKFNLTQSRRLKHGSMALVVTILFVVAVVVINLIASLILERFPTTVDLTTNKIFELTDESVDFAKDINEPIEIIVCRKEDTFTGNNYLKQISEIINGYSKYNSNVTVKYVDLLEQPEISSKYSAYGVSEMSVIITTEKRTKVLSLETFLEEKTNQNTQEKSVWSVAEKNMTSALMYVTDDTVAQASVLVGHSEVGAVNVTSMLSDNNYEIAEQNITTEEINPEAKIAVIYAPTTDYTDAELQKLDAFLDNGGKFDKTLIYLAAPQQPELPNLDSFLAEWGIKVGNGILAETNTKNMYDANGFIFAADYGEEAYTEDLRQKSLPYLANAARPLEVIFTEQDNRSTKVLLSSPESTLVYLPDENGEFDAEKAEQGSFPIALLGQRTKYDGTDPHISSVVVFSSVGMFQDELITNAVFNNNEYTINVLNKLTGKEESINIASVSFDAKKLTLTQSTYNAINIIFIGIIPLAILVCGIVIWIRRRHK